MSFPVYGSTVLPKYCLEMVGLQCCWAGEADAWLAASAPTRPMPRTAAVPIRTAGRVNLGSNTLRMVPSCH